ncbi:ER degradation-enhancing alpha-mannosidase-like protein 2 [Lepeophtheirus salmonis]|uniref:ER degradation-enhancing alpha-mannosidase-like protein 2 n=1 Tax=Lepeophtheirus salmonis TaxID=72036 RepID=UPI001AEABEA2|nr:ER degradation-enhancing alpha-mannosidase-like protein 2 [Lepeophtheirus salmonis]XP_040567807.1 ER degradation-enhancing alpha-mannosidase-like protein 2 [Lepeophtheirus salmonis]
MKMRTFILMVGWLLRLGQCSEYYSDEKIRQLRSSVKEMFQTSYDHYLNHAYPYDELMPISCSGSDTLGGYSLTLIDSLDTLAIMGNFTEFRRIYSFVSKVKDMDINANVSVFETNIRIVGGLLSAHLYAKSAGIDVADSWPCDGPLLHLAAKVATRLLPAFDTDTGMPYGTVNLRHGVPFEETPVSCVAGVGTFIVEFSVLSQLTGDPIYEEKAKGALNGLWKHRSKLDLVGNHVNVQTGKWTAVDAGIGAGVDSYFEYLVKGSVLNNDENLLFMFRTYHEAIKKKMMNSDWYFWVSMFNGNVTLPVFQSLEAFWPGVLSMIGEDEIGLKSIHNYRTILKQYGFLPEFYDVYAGKPVKNKEGYPLRPELIESLVYLYQTTKDPYLLEMGEMVLSTIKHSAKTTCGYATVKDVRDHLIEDRMESFFLAETTKYLYLLFDPTNPVHGTLTKAQIVHKGTDHECIIDVGGTIFNTEAHPMDPSIANCCQKQNASKKEHFPYHCFKSKGPSKFFQNHNYDSERTNLLKKQLRKTFSMDDFDKCNNFQRFSSKGLYCDSYPHHYRYLTKGEVFSSE